MPNSNRAIHRAAKCNNVKIIEFLLDEGDVDIDAEGALQQTALHFAAWFGNTEALSVLLARGADVNFASDCGARALHLASRRGKTRVAKLLLEHGADVNLQDDFKRTALHYAAMCGETEIVRLLLAAGAVVHLQDHTERTPLHWAAEGDASSPTPVLDERIEIVELLLNAETNIETRDNQKDTPLHLAAFKGNAKIVEMLLNKGALVNARNKFGETPLYLAVLKNWERTPEIVMLLLAYQADVNIKAKSGSILSCAIFSKNTKSIEILVRHMLINPSFENMIHLEKAKLDYPKTHYQIFHTILEAEEKIALETKAVTPAQSGFTHYTQWLPYKSLQCVTKLLVDDDESEINCPFDDRKMEEEKMRGSYSCVLI